jgi:outer membrane protein OmpA-like peptidoglycan-associated protein
MVKRFSFVLIALVIGISSAIAQDAQLRNVASGQRMKLTGVIVSKIDDNTFIVRDTTGVDTRVVISPAASIKNKAFWGGDKFASTALIRGLNLEVEGNGDGSGALSASKVRFERRNLEVAQSIESRVAPAEARLTAAEENAQRVSGQIDELMAISNAARGGAKAAQDTADAAVEGVNATNKRITDMDDYVVQSSDTVNFKVNSAMLSSDAKAKLDAIAQASTSLKGYFIEITGFASAEGSTAHNKALSQRRARAVIDYLIETHNIPLRRIGQSFGFGELQAVADNTTREGREQNRRVEVKLLVSRGLNQNVEVRQVKDDTED